MTDGFSALESAHHDQEYDPVALSAAFLRGHRTGADTSAVREALSSLPESALTRLGPEAARAFWLNCYNAATQHRLTDAQVPYGDRGAFFADDAVTVAGAALSLDAIEHGILRDGQSKLGLGYVPRLTASRFERRHTLTRDFRIHFALNCGAVSCPVIRAYDAETLDETLDAAAQRYLDESADYDAARNVARVPRLCIWFRGDFGGRRGVQRMLERYEQVPTGARPRLRYADWNWSLDPGDYH
jgi:hypothetical protein